MRVVKVWKSCGVALSHEYSRAFYSVNKANTPQGQRQQGRHFRMATTANEGEHWSAVRVRDTFLDYFKKNGHTFGECLEGTISDF